MKKKTLFFTASLVFAITYILLVKWGQTGDLSRMGNIIYGTVILLNLLVVGSFGFVIFKVNSQKTLAQLRKKILLLFLFFVLGALLISLTFVTLGNYVFYLMGGIETVDFINNLFQIEFPEALRQFSVWIPIVSGLLFYMLWRQTINREQQLHDENLKYQYRTLKAQVNPHFLFNTLNTLSEIVYIDSKKADNYIQKLSGIYRYILDNEKTDLISLDKELEFVMHYFELQKERDENKILLEIDIENADKFRVVPISLQILVENALKHNTVSEEKPLKIKIYKNDKYVMVSNKIQRKSVLGTSSTGIGFPNLKKRVKLITNKDVIINQENDLFLVELPIINI